jgi:hypothetical protein
LRDAIKQLDEKRFEVIHDISDWNTKYEAKIGQPFSCARRNTDIPGTIKNQNL